jgi:hypothetical protein
LTGKGIASGKRFKKNQKIEKEISLYLGYKRRAEYRITIKNKKLNNVGASKILLEIG